MTSHQKTTWKGLSNRRLLPDIRCIRQLKTIDFMNFNSSSVNVVFDYCISLSLFDLQKTGRHCQVSPVFYKSNKDKDLLKIKHYIYLTWVNTVFWVHPRNLNCPFHRPVYDDGICSQYVMFEFPINSRLNLYVARHGWIWIHYFHGPSPQWRRHCALSFFRLADHYNSVLTMQSELQYNNVYSIII